MKKTRLYYAFHYASGLNATYASDTSRAAGYVVAYTTKQLRDASCNDLLTCVIYSNQKVRAVRAVTRVEIVAMGHAKSLDTSTDMGAYVAAHVVGIDVDPAPWALLN
jgi:predicted sulfurtransferase